MNYPDREELLNKIYQRKREKFFNSDFAICELNYLEYPHHKTAYVTVSKVHDPDIVVIYSYGGLVPHLFYKTDDGKITDKTGYNKQFTYEWIDYWLDQNVAVVILDMPDYFIANGHPWANSFYRQSKDRLRETKHIVERITSEYPQSKICWAGLSYGAQEAAFISLEHTTLHKIASISGTWHVIPDVDEFCQGTRLDWYNVTDSNVPVLIVMHKKEVWEKAHEQMQLTDSILVTNDVSEEDGHFFRGRQQEVIKAICDWFRDKPVPKIIP
jgi:hypothetical protein